MFLFILIYLVLIRLEMTAGADRYHHQKGQGQSHKGPQHGAVKVRDCEPIEVALCRGLGYNHTGMPNYIGHETQQEAEQQLTTFTPLMQYGCSSRLTMFLCSAYVPLCTEKVLTPIGPCASLCEAVRHRCEPVLNEFGFPWPLALNCSKFPPRNEDDSMCMEGPPDIPDTVQPRTTPDLQPTPRGSSLGTTDGGGCEHYGTPANYIFLNVTRKCALLCSKDDVFVANQKMFAEAWMSVWSGLCFVTTLITILTFAIDSARFHYPERAIVFMAFCYNICSLSYLIRLIAGRETIACRLVRDSIKVLVPEGLENAECTVVFLLLYYFSMASSVWWAILTVLWFLNSGLDRSYESLARHGTLLHAVSWSVPAIATIAVIVLKSIEADELTGLCQVGHHNQASQVWFVLLPTGVLLLVSVVFLFAGFICSFRLRKESDGTGSDKTPVVVVPGSTKVRIGAFCLVHAILTTCILSVQSYEYANRQHWSPVLAAAGAPPQRTPNVAVLMFGVAANLTIGIASAIWLWRGESLQSWQRFFTRFSRCCCGCCCGCGASLRSKDEIGVRKATPGAPASSVQVPLNRQRPIYRVTPEIAERSGADSHVTTWGSSSSHHFHRHYHHRNPLIGSSSHGCPGNSAVAPPPSSDNRRSSSRTPLQCRTFNGSDMTVL